MLMNHYPGMFVKNISSSQFYWFMEFHLEDKSKKGIDYVLNRGREMFNVFLHGIGKNVLIPTIFQYSTIVFLQKLDGGQK